jgi:hypothetical protein
MLPRLAAPPRRHERARDHSRDSGDGSMSELAYTCRRLARWPECSYRLRDDALVWSEGGCENGVAFTKIRSISLYRVLDDENSPPRVDCALKVAGSGDTVLSSLHRNEDQAAQLRPFVEALARRAAAANSNLMVYCGAPGWSNAWTITALALCIAIVLYGLGAALLRTGSASMNLLLAACGIAGAGFQYMQLLNYWPRRCGPADTEWQEIWQAHDAYVDRSRMRRADTRG